MLVKSMDVYLNAVYEGDLDKVRQLYRPEYRERALVEAVKYNRPKTVKFLASQGGSISRECDDALTRELEDSNWRMTAYLVGAGIRICPFLATRAAVEGDLEKMKVLFLQRVPSRSSLNNLLITAGLNDNFKVARYLIFKGARSDEEALILTLSKSSSEVAEVLYDAYYGDLSLENPFLQRLEQDRDSIKHSLLPFAPNLSSLVAEYY